MPSSETLLIFTAAALLMNIAPGPSNLYVMSRSIAQGSTAGLAAVAGLALGSLFHVTMAAFGLAAIFIYSPLAYSAVKLCGAGYLIFLGLRYLRSKPQPAVIDRPATRRSLMKIVRESALVEMTNPKSALFFLAFLPQFVDTAAGPPAPQLLVLGLIVTLSAIPCDLLVSYGSHKAARWLAGNRRVQLFQERISGTILIALGAYIAFDERPGA